MFNKHVKTFQYGNQTVTLETGEIARQAAAAVKVSMGDTVVLVAVTTNKEVKEGQDFFPLTVDYLERTYAAGKIPGGFFKREGKQSEKEILTSRLIDRPIRPLFPEGFYHDIQIVAMVVSVDPEIDSDIPAMLGASAALVLSGVPFAGPIGAARVGYVNGVYVLNPTKAELAKSQLDLVVAGRNRRFCCRSAVVRRVGSLRRRSAVRTNQGSSIIPPVTVCHNNYSQKLIKYWVDGTSKSALAQLLF